MKKKSWYTVRRKTNIGVFQGGDVAEWLEHWTRQVAGSNPRSCSNLLLPFPFLCLRMVGLVSAWSFE